MASNVIAWDVKLRPGPTAKGMIPFRTVVYATTKPMAIQAAKLQFSGCAIVEPPKKREDANADANAMGNG